MGRQKIAFRSYAKEAAEIMGASIRIARANRNWTAQELADRSGCSRRTIAKIESGEPEVSWGHVLNVATVAGVPLFVPDPAELRRLSRSEREKVRLLPSRVDPVREVFDDF